MTYFLLIAYSKLTRFYYFLRIYDIIKIIVMTCFFVNCVFENDMFYYFLQIRNNCDDMFFANYVFENIMFMYILLNHLYQPNY